MDGRQIPVLDLSCPTRLDDIDDSGVVVMVLGLQGEKEGHVRS